MIPISPATDLTDPSARFRLPYTVEPRRYELRLAPDLQAATFHGEVTIEASAHEPVTEIVLHAAELAVSSARLSHDGATIELMARLEEDDERLVLVAPRPLPAGPLTIDIAFDGILNDQLHGFYRSVYRGDDGTEHPLAVTQFEATDARRAFPCFDEPDRKAVFAVTLDVPEGLQAFSNGPELEVATLPDGTRRIRFGDTIPMSTYLVAFVVGALEATAPVDVDGTPVRVVHAPGKAGLTDYALEVAAHSLRFFADWFGIPYPSDKLDLLAIPDFAFGAMENLGCVTFREAVLLVDPQQASRLELERVADVIAHEIAHMWFGDLVTMKWWNGIWLNEAFATLMELLCVDAFRPEWERWVSFGTERDGAMATDALHTTRPVEFPVGPPEEAQAMFDVLTYQKGAGVLRMLERYLGAKRFRRGIRRYLNDHRLGNTETADLWDALEAESGEPVRAVMDSWILQGGFPLVSVSDRDETADVAGPTGATDATELALTQEPFAYSPVAEPKGDAASAIGEVWSVPVITRALDGGEGRALLEGPSGVVVVEGAKRGAPVVVNAGGAGYYRVLYTADRQRQLAERASELEPLERFNLVSDTWASVVAGRAEIGDFLSLAGALRDDDDPSVWAQVTGALSFLHHAVEPDTRDPLARATRALVAPTFARLGWERRADDGERTPTLRAQLLATLATIGEDAAVRAEAKQRLRAAGTGANPLDPDLASAVLAAVASGGGRAEFDQFVEHYRHPATPQEELRYLGALAAFRDPGLAERAFELAIGEVRTQNAPFVIMGLLGNTFTGPAAWELVTQHWSELTERIPDNLQARMIDGVKLLCRDEGLAHRIRGFVAEHPLRTGQRTVDQTLERLDVNVAFSKRLGDGRARHALNATAEHLETH